MWTQVKLSTGITVKAAQSKMENALHIIGNTKRILPLKKFVSLSIKWGCFGANKVLILNSKSFKKKQNGTNKNRLKRCTDYAYGKPHKPNSKCLNGCVLPSAKLAPDRVDCCFRMVDSGVPGRPAQPFKILSQTTEIFSAAELPLRKINFYGGGMIMRTNGKFS